MGFFDFLGRQFRKVIQWESDDPNTIVWKYPLERKEEFMRNSVLVVREGQKAMFIREGKLADVFGPGTYKLDDLKIYRFSPLFTTGNTLGKLLTPAICISYRPSSS